jgi:hypothetical protein
MYVTQQLCDTAEMQNSQRKYTDGCPTLPQSSYIVQFINLLKYTFHFTSPLTDILGNPVWWQICKLLHAVSDEHS